MRNQTSLDSQQKNWRQYEKMVWSRGWKRFLSDIGVLPTLLTLAASIGTALVIQTTRSQTDNVLADAAIALIVFTLLCLTALIWYVSRESVIIYDEQANTISELEPDDPFEFVLKSPHRLENGIVWVGIDIVSNSTHSVNCSASVQKESMKRPSVLEPMFLDGVSHRNPFEISGNTNLPFYFACSAKGWPNAVLNTSDDAERRIHVGRYELSIILRGESSDGRPVSHSENFVLIYGGDDSIGLVKKNSSN